MYQFLNYFFFVFHTVLILFNSLGWIFNKTRKWNLATLLITAFSWFFLGIWYGWGYCFCTDWHWQVRKILGYEDYTNSYVQLLLINLAGKSFPEGLVNAATVLVFFISLLMSLWLNIRDWRRRRG